MSAFDCVSNLIQSSTDYRNDICWTQCKPTHGSGLHWVRVSDSVYRIDNCIDFEQASRTIFEFAQKSKVDADLIFGLSNFMLSLIPAACKPKIFADYSQDFNGLWDFSLRIEDYLILLKKKAPASLPKYAKAELDFKETKTSYIFGLEYDPEHKLYKLRYKLHPQKTWWGYRWDPRFRTSDDLAKVIFRELPQYYIEEQISASMKALIKQSEQQEQLDLQQNESDFL